MNHLSRLVRALIRRLLLEVIYWPIAIFVAVASGFRWRSWCRNSLALGYWSLHSDLDLTLFSSTEKVLPNSIVWLWKRTRPLGEWAVFCASDQRWLDLGNPWEIERDPRLVEVLRMHPREPSPAESFVFWLRMHGGRDFCDFNVSKIQRRQEKWQFHLRQLVSRKPVNLSRPFPFSVQEAAERLAPIEPAQWLEQRMYLWPHLWLGDALFQQMPTSRIFAAGPSELLDIARAQVQWEMWGLLSQIRLERNFESVLQHLTQLADLFPEGDTVRGTIQEFEAYLRQGVMQTGTVSAAEESVR